MFFSGPNGFMTEKKLHCPDVFTVGKQFNRKGIPEPMGSGFDSRKTTDTGDGSPGASCRAFYAPVTTPKKIIGLDRQLFERSQAIRLQLDVDRHSGFHGAHHQAPVFSEVISAQANHIRNTKTRVKQQQEQRLSSGFRPLSALAIRVLYSVACLQHGRDLVIFIRHGYRRMFFWRFDSGCKVLRNPFLIDAELAKGAQHFDLFPLRRYRQVSAGAEAAEVIDPERADIGNLAPLAVSEESRKSGFVARDGRFRQLARMALIQEFVDRIGNCQGPNHISVDCRFHLVREPGCDRPISSAKRFTNRAPGDRTVAPDDACALRESLSFIRVLAAGTMPAIEIESHSACTFLSSRFVQIPVQERIRLKISHKALIGKGLGRLELGRLVGLVSAMSL